MDQLLLEICLEGFKSFRDRTVLKFDGPFTAIVGPNGSGKSNVVDAVKWVLGDTSPRSIRASTGLDAIYRSANGDGKEDAGFASVILKINNSSPESEDEPLVYEIERRYYRSSESVYFINGKVARLRDVRALMAKKGFGLDSLSVVSQGEIEGFLSLVPTDRRVVFEELARIADFKSNRKKILTQLEEVARNYQRLQDLIGEISTRVDELAVQAASARRYQELSNALNEVNALLAAQEYLLAKRNLERHESRLKDLLEELELEKKREEEALERISQLKEALISAKQENASIVSECEQKRASLERVKAEERRLTEAERYLVTLAANLDSEVVERKRRLEKLRSRIEELEAVVDRAEAERSYAIRWKLELELYLARRWGYMRAVERERRRLSGKLERLGSELEHFMEDVESLTRRTESLKVEIDKLNALKEALIREHCELKENLVLAENVRVELLEHLRGISFERRRIVNRLEILNGLRLATEGRRSALSSEIVALRREHALLSELEAAREGYGEGVKAVLARQDEFEGLLGTVGELIKPVHGKERVVETVLGDAIEYLVCDTFAHAIEVIERAKKERLGVVTCIVLELVPEIFRMADSESFSICTSPPQVYPVLAMLLGGVKEVETIARCRVGELRGTLVSSEGDVFREPSFLSGGVSGSRQPGILVRRARLEEIALQLEQLQKELLECAESSAKQAEDVAALELELGWLDAMDRQATERLRTLDMKLKSGFERLEVIRREMAELDRRHGELEVEHNSCVENVRGTISVVESMKRLRSDTQGLLEIVESELYPLR